MTRPPTRQQAILGLLGALLTAVTGCQQLIGLGEEPIVGVPEACGTPPHPEEECRLCMNSNCCVEQQRCSEDASCAQFAHCIAYCWEGTCANACRLQFPGAATDAIYQCAPYRCSEQCFLPSACAELGEYCCDNIPPGANLDACFGFVHASNPDACRTAEQTLVAQYCRRPGDAGPAAP